MDAWIKILIMGTVGAIIGYSTNVIAIKLMFRPINPIQLKPFKFEIQGLIPKRKADIATSIGEIIESELISIEEIIDKLIEQSNKEEMIAMIKDKIVTLAEEKMPSIVPSAFKGMILNYVDEIIEENGEQILIEISENMVHKATHHIHLSKIIETKINAFPFEKLEEIILEIAKKELKHIEVLGGVLGLMIGLVQGLVIIML